MLKLIDLATADSHLRLLKELDMTNDIVTKGDEKGLEADIHKYGIKRIPVDYFHINGFRYTDLKDAVAQAKRAKTVKGAI